MQDGLMGEDAEDIDDPHDGLVGECPSIRGKHILMSL